MLGFTRVRRHTLAASATAVALAVVLAGCSSDGDSGKDAAKDSGKDASNSAGAFPVSIKSSLGTAEIKEKPQRIVTLGQGSAETAIALGQTPVGIESYPWGSDKSGYLPWIDEAVKKSGDKLPKQFTGGEEIDFEAITELEPDVILAPWSGITQKQYDVLKDIAPTVAYPDQAWSTDWDQQIDIIGKALGRTKDTDALKTKIEKQLSDAAATRPNYKGVTFSYIYNTGPGTLGVFKPEEQRVKMVSSLGLTVDPVVNGFKETPGTDSALIGLENAEKLKDSDVIFTFYTDEKNRKEIEGQKLYGEIPAIKKGAVVASNDNSFVTASSIINPLTVPWTIERYLPIIDEAVKKAAE
ncbi:iron-siderophore ABC transporter substrate-binding protein [Streptomyces bacillaris]